MELNKENMRKIRKLILFTALLIVVLWKYEEVLEVLGYVGHLIFPFLLGGAIAFVLNVPMNFIERHLFMEKVRKNKVLDKLARPVSVELSIFPAPLFRKSISVSTILSQSNCTLLIGSTTSLFP